jgi:putative ATP-dependent endonuclease of the OLD family
LIGPGDSGKSTILDAIDLCLGARRGISISDVDFFELDITRPISIAVTLGDLPDALENIESYGDFLRALNAATGEIEEEPRYGLETVPTLDLTFASDLEALWTLVSLRAEQQGLERSIAWKDRSAVAASRFGNYASSDLSGTKGSVLNRISEQRANVGAELARAAREARAFFGGRAGAQLAEARQAVNDTAASLGVPVGASARALLDARPVSTR